MHLTAEFIHRILFVLVFFKRTLKVRIVRPQSKSTYRILTISDPLNFFSSCDCKWQYYLYNRVFRLRFVFVLIFTQHKRLYPTHECVSSFIVIDSRTCENNPYTE